jgi:hypothetical protein
MRSPTFQLWAKHYGMVEHYFKMLQNLCTDILFQKYKEAGFACQIKKSIFSINGGG